MTTWDAPVGAPAAAAASPMMRAASAQTAAANGCGEMTMALRVNSANMIFAKVVATGLVDGVSARITPAGRGNRRIFGLLVDLWADVVVVTVGLPEAQRTRLVLDDLVLHDAETGLPHRRLGEITRCGGAGPGRGLRDPPHGGDVVASEGP